MEEDNTQYYNDEWNQSKSFSENPEIVKYTLMYNILMDKLNKLLEEELIKEGTNTITRLPKEFNSKNNKPDGRRYKK